MGLESPGKTKESKPTNPKQRVVWGALGMEEEAALTATGPEGPLHAAMFTVRGVSQEDGKLCSAVFKEREVPHFRKSSYKTFLNYSS